MLRSESAVSFACLKCYQLHLSPKTQMPTESAQRGITLLFVISAKNALFRSYSTFVYLPCVQIHNTNRYMHITSAHGHEWSEGLYSAHGHEWSEGLYSAHGHEWSEGVCAHDDGIYVASNNTWTTWRSHSSATYNLWPLHIIYSLAYCFALLVWPHFQAPPTLCIWYDNNYMQLSFTIYRLVLYIYIIMH